MIVTCPRCLTKFNLTEEALESGVELNLHCSRCEWDFLFSIQSSDLDTLQDDFEESLVSEVEEFEAETDFDRLGDEVELVEEGGAAEIETANVNEEVASADVSPMVVEEADDFIDEVFDESIFELADDFGDDDASLSNEPTEPPEVPEEISEPSEKGEGGDGERKVEELALDLDDLNLDDIEFDSFDDEPDSESVSEEVSEKSENVHPTKLDDEDLDSFLNQDEDKAAAVSIDKKRSTEESDKQVEVEVLLSPDSGKVSTDTNKKRNFILVLSCFVALSLALWAGYGLWQRFSVDMVKHLQLIEVENRRLLLPSGRSIIVQRGKVVNTSPKLVTNLKFTGVLLDEEGQIVAQVVTAGGVSFSEDELDRLDASKLVMLENTSVTLAANGGELPFMIAFYDYPEKASKCYVELTSFKVKKGRRP